MTAHSRRTKGPESTRVIVYCRVSSQEQADRGISLVAQRRRLEAYCAAHGLRVAGVQEDAGISARKTTNRPALQAALVAGTGKGPASGSTSSLRSSRVATSSRQSVLSRNAAHSSRDMTATRSSSSPAARDKVSFDSSRTKSTRFGFKARIALLTERTS